MRDVVLYITSSLDGFIADASGGVDWLVGEDGEEYGYSALLASVDTVLMGSRTWMDTLELTDEDPYADKTVVVFTSQTDLPSRGNVRFVAEDAADFARRLVAEPGGRIWCVGGGEIASALFSAGLISEIDLFVQPIVLGDGVPLWRPPIAPRRLRLLEARAWPGDLAELRFAVQEP